MLGTFVSIQATGSDRVTPECIQAAIDAAFRAVARVDLLMSVHRYRSDIGRLNRSRPGASVLVHRWTYQVLSQAQTLWRDSGGTFDCNVGKSLMKAGLLPKRCGSGATSPALSGTLGMAITLRAHRRIGVARSSSIDLGGIAKGFAIDQAVQVLQAHHMSSGVVNAGGDLRTFGQAAQPIWRRCPTDPSTAEPIGHLQNGAIATSAPYFTQHKRRVNRYSSAIVNPKTNTFCAMPNSVSVIARTGMLADALTKIAAIRGQLPRRLARHANARLVGT